MEKHKARYALESDEPTAVGIARVARAQLDRAREFLAHPEHPEAIHDARKALKRVRSLLRVSRPLLAEATYRSENATLRGVGHALSDTRDSQALIESLDRLQERRRTEVPAQATGQLRLSLVTSGSGSVAATESQVGDLPATLASVGARAGTWTDSELGTGLLEGFTHSYRRGRRALRRVRHEPSVEQLHELRKRAKDLWYGSQLLSREHPKRMKALGQRAHALSDLLGDHHDLALLRDRAHALHGPSTDADWRRLQSVIDEELESLEKKALRAARKLYRRAPGKLRRRLRA